MDHTEKQEIKELIALGELKRAIALLLSTQLSRSKRQEAEVLSSRLNEIEKSNRAGVLKEDDYRVERSKIRKAMLDFIYEYETKTFDPSKSGRFLSILKQLRLIIPILLGLVLLLNWLNSNQKFNLWSSINGPNGAAGPIEIQGTQGDPIKIDKNEFEKTKDQPQNEEIKLNNTNTQRNLMPEIPTINLYNEKFKGSLALVDVDLIEDSRILESLYSLLSKESYQVTTSFFRSDFNTAYRSRLWEDGMEIMESISLPSNVKCLCLIKEKLVYQSTDTLGHIFFVAKGEVALKILNNVNGEVSKIVIPVGGPGADFRRAYESFLENFIKQFNMNDHLKKFEPCKN